MARVRKLAGRNSELAAVEQSVQRIILDVRRQGDRALRRYAESWDGLEKGAKLRVTGDQMQAAWESSDPRFRSSLRSAAANIRRYWQPYRPCREICRASLEETFHHFGLRGDPDLLVERLPGGIGELSVTIDGRPAFRSRGILTAPGFAKVLRVVEEALAESPAER